MNGPNVLSGLTDLTSQVKNTAASTATAAAVGKAAAVAQSMAPTATAAMRDILSKYDITDITPNDFSKLIQQMSQKGAISQKDAQELSSIRVDLENAGVNSDESVNLLEFYQQQIAKVQSAAAQSSNPGTAKPALDALVGRLNWVQKFAAVSQGGIPNGLNAMA